MVCGACTDSVYQALFTAYAKEPGDVATEVFVIPTLTQLVSLTEVFVLFCLRWSLLYGLGSQAQSYNNS